MATQREKVFAFLDEKLGFGAGCVITDYDSKSAVLDYAIEYVGEDEGLTMMCGVGPLMDDIEAWLDAFEAGERTEVNAEDFCLSIKFDPAALGYTFFRTLAAFKETYPTPHHRPSHFPVFAKEVALKGAAASAMREAGECLLTYLYLSEVTVVG